ncbi:hypothetical protein Nepgr_017421 [Nepenthes gracilis]|uniref:Uncharacterized protein n=1 Tax=Nepenthes gracilis TaxID=150966 RepID=A0AAD3SRE6_NEPGR|nr:hypothetical protein Nepgr_017421 [Nepenthes gracilis]
MPKKTSLQSGRTRSNPSNAIPDENVQGVMAMGSDQPLIEAVTFAPPFLVEGDCQPVVSTPFATGGHDLELECPSSGVLLESLGPSHSKPLELQTQDFAELDDASGTLIVGDVAGHESGALPRASVPAVNSWDQAGLVHRLIAGFPCAEGAWCCTSDVLHGVAKKAPEGPEDPVGYNAEAGGDTIASCPAILQQCNQQSAQLFVPSAGCNSAGFNSQTLPPEPLALTSPSPPFPDPEPLSTLEPFACGLQIDSAPQSSSVVFGPSPCYHFLGCDNLEVLLFFLDTDGVDHLCDVVDAVGVFGILAYGLH